jgi:LysR family transcriptional regulator, transcriptional activator of nhaA
MFNFNHLYYFYISARSENLTAAAKHLRISQPSLSSQLRVLENKLDLKLFKRVGRQNQLTQGGSLILSYCEKMFSISEDLDELIMERRPDSIRHINLGISNQIAPSFVFEIIAGFSRTQALMERSRMSLQVFSPEELSDRLQFRELDLVISHFEMDDPSLCNIDCIESPVMLIHSHDDSKAPPSVRSSDYEAILSELHGQSVIDWILPNPGSTLREEIDQYFSEHEVKNKVLYESSVLPSILHSVEMGLGSAFFPLIYIPSSHIHKRVDVWGPKDGFWQHKIWISCHNQSENDKLIQDFLSFFNKVSSDLINPQLQDSIPVSFPRRQDRHHGPRPNYPQ